MARAFAATLLAVLVAYPTAVIGQPKPKPGETKEGKEGKEGKADKAKGGKGDKGKGDKGGKGDKAAPAPGDKAAAPGGGGGAGGGAGGGGGGDAGKPVDMPEDNTVADPSGMEENPGKPTGALTAKIDETPTGVVVTAPPPKVREPYPIEEVWRPLTLPRLMSEAGFDVRDNIDPFIANTTLRGRFGITKKIQVGLEYTIGGFYDDDGAGDGGVRFNTGKAIGLDLTYGIFGWLAARMAVPMYFSPYSIGVTLGAPMKFHIGEKFAFGGFNDFISITIRHFTPSTTSEFYNEGLAGQVNTGGMLPAGAIRLSGFAVYQAKTNLAIGGRFGVAWEDFKDSDALYGVWGTLQYSTSKKLDFGGQAGLGDLSDARNSIQVNLFAQMRI